MVNYPDSFDNNLTIPPLDGYQAPFGNPTVEDVRQAVFSLKQNWALNHPVLIKIPVLD